MFFFQLRIDMTAKSSRVTISVINVVLIANITLLVLLIYFSIMVMRIIINNVNVIA